MTTTEQINWESAKAAVLERYPDAFASKCVSWDKWHIFADSQDTKGLSVQECEAMNCGEDAWLDAHSKLAASPVPPAQPTPGQSELPERPKFADCVPVPMLSPGQKIVAGKFIVALEAALQTVLQREAATAARNDSKLDSLEAALRSEREQSKENFEDAKAYSDAAKFQRERAERAEAELAALRGSRPAALPDAKESKDA